MTSRQGEVSEPSPDETAETDDTPSESKQTRSKRTYKVDLAAGGNITVQSLQEREWFNNARDRYVEENRFTDVSDLEDLDRLLQSGLLLYRFGQWLSSGKDYEGNDVNEASLSVKVKNLNETVSRLKDNMGLSKKARASVTTSVAEKWDELRRRAKEFGYMREDQLRKSLNLMHDISWIIDTFDRCDEEERKKIGFATEHDILEWVRNTMIPEYKAVDAYFVEHKQKLWKQT